MLLADGLRPSLSKAPQHFMVEGLLLGVGGLSF